MAKVGCDYKISLSVFAYKILVVTTFFFFFFLQEHTLQNMHPLLTYTVTPDRELKSCC